MKHTINRREQTFQDWKAQEKYTRIQAFYEEVGHMHERIKTRLFSLFILSILLCAVSTIGASSSAHYALPCGLMLAGFSVTTLMTVFGLWTTPILTANVAPQTIDTLLDASSPAPNTKAAGKLVLARAFEEFANHNADQAVKDRKYLKAAWITLVTTPSLAGIMALIIHGWG